MMQQRVAQVLQLRVEVAYIAYLAQNYVQFTIIICDTIETQIPEICHSLKLSIGTLHFVYEITITTSFFISTEIFTIRLST